MARKRASRRKVYFQSKSGAWMELTPKGAKFTKAPTKRYLGRDGKLHAPPKAKPKGKAARKAKGPQKAGPEGLRKLLDRTVSTYLHSFPQTDSPESALWTIWTWRWPTAKTTQVSWNDVYEWAMETSNRSNRYKHLAAQVIAFYVYEDSDKRGTLVRTTSLSHAVTVPGAFASAAAQATFWDSKYERTRVVGVGVWVRTDAPIAV